MTTKLKAILIICAAVFIVYSNSLGGDFIYDDEYFVVRNIAIRNLSNIPSFFINPASVSFSQLAEDVYRPLSATSYALDYFLWFYNTFGYHLENVLLHGLNAVFVLILLNLITGDIFIAFFASLFFACHPVQTEVVSWISGRASVLFLFFYLAALVLYVRSILEGRKGLMGWSLALYTASLFTKEMAVTLPLVIIAYDAHFFNKDTFRKKIIRYMPYVGLTVMYLGLRTVILKRVSQCDWWGGNAYYNFLSALAVIPEYLRLLIYPAELSAFYVSRIARSAAETQVILSAVFLAGIFLALPFIFRKSRIVSFSVYWFFITMLPVSNIIPLKALLAERFLYLPSIGFCVILAVIIGSMRLLKIRHANAIAAILAVSIGVSYSVRTMIRNEDWKDPITISRSIIKVSPLNPWGYTSLGSALIDAENYEDAVKPLKKAIALSKRYASPRNALGHCYIQLGRYEDALIMLKEALRLNPRNLETITSMGVAYASLNRNEEAVDKFKEAIKIDPTFVSAHLNLGAVYERTGQDDKAVEVYNQIPVRTNSPQDIAIAYIRLGDLNLRKGDGPKALGYYQKALTVCGTKFAELKDLALDRIKRCPKVDIPAN